MRGLTEPQPADDVARRTELSAVVGRLTEDSLDTMERTRLLGRLLVALGDSARVAGVGVRGGAKWLSDVLLDIAPHIPVRDLATLRAHHEGLSGEALADALVRSASRATAAVGAAGGAIGSAQYAAPPTLLATPIRLAAETLAVLAIEVKLVAELHEVYGVEVPGSGSQRAVAFVTAWMRKRGVDPTDLGSFTAVIGTAARRQLRQRVLRTLGRQTSTVVLFAGVVAGAELNRRETVSLGDKLRHDLRRRRFR